MKILIEHLCPAVDGIPLAALTSASADRAVPACDGSVTGVTGCDGCPPDVTGHSGPARGWVASPRDTPPSVCQTNHPLHACPPRFRRLE